MAVSCISDPTFRIDATASAGTFVFVLIPSEDVLIRGARTTTVEDLFSTFGRSFVFLFESSNRPRMEDEWNGSHTAQELEQRKQAFNTQRWGLRAEFHMSMKPGTKGRQG